MPGLHTAWLAWAGLSRAMGRSSGVDGAPAPPAFAPRAGSLWARPVVPGRRRAPAVFLRKRAPRVHRSAKASRTVIDARLSIASCGLALFRLTRSARYHSSDV